MSTNASQIRVLLVSEAKEARRLCGLLGSNGSTPFHILHVCDVDLAAERLSRDEADILLLEIGPRSKQVRAFMEAARAAAPDMPLVMLSDCHDEALAIEALKHGAQDFLVKDSVDRAALDRSLRYAIERHRLHKNLQTLSLIDDLTGLHNRRGFLALAEQHLRVIVRKGAALLVYLDVDDLKMINDTYGHLEGNRALIVTANALRACFRQSDILARLGGDEFCVLMTDAGPDSPQQVRKRLQQRVDSMNDLSSWRFRLSLSIGVAEVPLGQRPTLEELLAIADTRMYLEKRNKQPDRSSSSEPKQTTVA